MDFEVSILSKTLKIIWASSPKWTVLRFSLHIVSHLLPLLTIFILKYVIDQIEAGISGEETFEMSVLYPYIGLWLFIALLHGMNAQYLRYVKEVHDFKLQMEVQKRIHRKALEIPYAYYDTTRYHDIFYRAQRESNSKPQKLVEDLSALIGNAFGLLGVLAIIASLDVRIAALLLLVSIPAIWSQWKFSRGLYDHSIQASPKERMTAHLAKVLTLATFAKEVRLFGTQSNIQALFERLKSELFRGRLQHVKAFLKNGSLAVFMEILLLVFFITFTVQQVVAGMITIGAFVMYFQAFQKGQNSLKMLFKKLLTVFESRLFLGHMFQFLELPSEATSRGEGMKLEVPISSIVMDQVHFTYPEDQREVLKSISFQVRKGDLIGVIGENGSGKSTLMKIMSGFYTPTSGHFKINGTPFEELDLYNYWERVSIVAQDYAKYQVNAGFNIAYREGEWDEKRMEESIRLADLDKVVGSFDQGLQTPMSKSFVKGKELSGGQWQKFALARSIYKNSSLLLLDEPTSHLDGAATLSFFQNIKASSHERITFLVTHRLSNLVYCDKIWVMADGQLMEEGDLDWMMEHSPLFNKIFAGQLNLGKA